MAEPVDLRLDPEIRDRGTEMYLSGKDPAKPKDVGRGRSVLESAVTLLGQFTHNPIGAVQAITQHHGIRNAKIAELASSPTFRSTYDKSSNTYSGLNPIVAALYDIKPDDISSKVIAERQKAVRRDPAYQALEVEYADDRGLKELFPKGSLTTLAEINKASSNLNTRTELLTALDKKVLGPSLLAQEREKVGGRRLTNSELAQLRSKATLEDPQYIEARNAAEQLLKESKSRVSIAERGQDLAEVKRIDANNQANSEIDLANRRLGVEERNAAAERDYNWRSDEADRDLKETLTMLGFDDKAAERELRYEEKQEQNRQLMILQLLKGLQGLGGAFAN